MSTINAKEELLNILNENSLTIKAALIFKKSYYAKNDIEAFLKVNYTIGDLVNFLETLDFEYNNGYNTQELYGTVWLTNGNWIERGEYDGSEWWEYKTCPEIPDELKESI